MTATGGEWGRNEAMAPSRLSPLIPEVLAQEIVEDLEAALEQFRLIAEDLGEEKDINERTLRPAS